MNALIGSLPSYLQLHIYEYDDTYKEMYKDVIVELLHYSMFNNRAIHALNHFYPSKYSLNRYGKITTEIRKSLHPSSIHERATKIQPSKLRNLQKDVAMMYKPHINEHNPSSRTDNGRSKRFVSIDDISPSDYRDFLSYRKYGNVGHYNEFREETCNIRDLIVLALILNGLPYRYNYGHCGLSPHRIKINAHLTQFHRDMYHDMMTI